MSATTETLRVELRCPVGAKRLLGVMRLSSDSSEQPKIVDGNLLELACRDCRSVVEAREGKRPSLVLHHYNILGELVDSVAVF